jgi:predicted DNA-binding transcriptional regulator YafY
MKRLWNLFFPPMLDKHPALILINAQQHLGDRIFATGSFRHEGQLPAEDKEALDILRKAIKECM